MTPEKIVTLSDGTEVKVRRVLWPGYVAIKNLVIATLAGPLTQSVLSLLQGPLTAFVGHLLTTPRGPQESPATSDPQSFAEYAETATEAATETEKPADAEPSPPSPGPFTSDRLATALASAAPLLEDAVTQAKAELPILLRSISGVTDDLTKILLEHAVVSPNGWDHNAADWMDVAAVIDAAYELNDPADLMAREKNFLAAVASSGRRLMTQDRTSTGTSS
jgi:hypothetical protein